MRIIPATGLTLLLMTTAPSVADAGRRGPAKDYRWGRCLLVVDGKTLISGRCGYQITKGGEFYIAGPRQVYEGVDYPRCPAAGESPSGCGAMQQSNDYWARVFPEPDGTWRGYGNSDIRATHGDVVYRPLIRKGACYVGETDTGRTFDGETFRGLPVRICLWRR